MLNKVRFLSFWIWIEGVGQDPQTGLGGIGGKWREGTGRREGVAGIDGSGFMLVGTVYVPT